MPTPRVVAVIPARGGSKGVQGKNLRRVAGRSLVQRAVDACVAATSIDVTYVSTDDATIAQAAREAGAEVVDRPADLSGDTASSESALLHALDQLAADGAEPEIVVFVQCTSPFIAPGDLDRAVGMVADGQADSAFAAVPTYEFLWRSGPDGQASGINHDPAYRPRRQEREPHFRETGAFYVMSVAGFRAARHRFFGRTAVVQVPELSAVEIDHDYDLTLASALAAAIDPRVRVDVDVVVTDFDGVHTDDAAIVDEDGYEAVRVSRADGLGVERLRNAGVPILILSKETNRVVRARAAKLGVDVLHGIEAKAEVVRDWLRRQDVAPERAAYLGNDINDLGPMELVGWPVAVADAHPAVRRAARLVLSHSGGHGAVRELCDLVLAARDAATRWIGRHSAGGTTSRSRRRVRTQRDPVGACPGVQPAGRAVGQQLVEQAQPGVLLRRVKVVRGHPRRVGGVQAARGQVGQRAQATRALEDRVDHLRRDAEVAQDQYGPAGGDRLQRSRGGHRGQSPGLDQRLVHRPGCEPDCVRRHPLLPDQVRVQLWVGPGFVMGLPLGAQRPELDHGRAGLGQGQQDLLPVGPGGRHLGLGGEQQVGSQRREVRIVRPAGEVRQRGQPEGWPVPTAGRPAR